MQEARFDTNLFKRLKNILNKSINDQQTDEMQRNFEKYFKEIPLIETLLIAYELKNVHREITSLEIEQLFKLLYTTFGYTVDDLYSKQLQESGHPVQVFHEENKNLMLVLTDVARLMTEITNNIETSNNQDSKASNNLLENIKSPSGEYETMNKTQEENFSKRALLINDLKEKYLQLGRFFSHYHRKEKLFFPILERYGHFTLARMMWADDDQIRNLYKGTKSMIERLPKLPFKYVQKSFKLFEDRFKSMIFQEQSFLLPVVCHYFSEEDWLAVGKESDAYGFVMDDVDELWQNKQSSESTISSQTTESIDFESTPIPFGGGYLTIKEADQILNNLPVEITFVDKFGVFKYFNDKVKSSEMMFIRTPTSIGRNVGHCHPPKSMQKVAQLISDLKTKRRLIETMWFKKDGKYIHITYKGLFDQDDNYLGILEYVQDIQPFLELPRKVKKEIAKIDDKNRK